MATFQTGGYPAPLPGFAPGYYSSPQSSPYAAGHYYTTARPAYAYPTTPLPKGHARRATGDGFNYPQTTPQRNSYAYAPQEQPHYSSAPPKQSSRRPDYERVYTAAAHPTGQSHNRRASFTAQYSSSRPTTSSKPTERPSTGYGSREKPTSRGKREATEADALRHKIPAGYSIKFWDPNEEPILLLGSVFDADSLGKWIYDWAAHFYGAASPLAEEAGELWVLLINLSHKIKLAEEVMGRVRSPANRDLLEDFLDSGERIWQRFSKLLKICEESMWQTAKRECAGAARVTMGKNSGLAFVEAMFDRDCELRTTEKLMQNIRLWVMRYDVNCVPILHDPRA